ncbi:hypothetical protein A5731_00480 [Mycolicibacterium conceptionense]|uniref:DUF7419 family protein n=1 Tax=Mycolicibacterium conceptionense TaxID=451644 RepID=UPI0007EB34FF|nr:hypothetical protein [Mycolicibacterium conceptionense]OBB15478.1 hypothetical protein A5718_29870 [Mycolicibacterium conceptionense]OBF09220.1 hypothetical protein A5731_00480 [Mycolicibacterium conceptionense]
MKLADIHHAQAAYIHQSPTCPVCWQPRTECQHGKDQIRERIAHHIRQLAYKFSPPEEHIATVYDGTGIPLCEIAFTGGFVATHPPQPYDLRFNCDDESGDQQ